MDTLHKGDNVVVDDDDDNDDDDNDNNNNNNDNNTKAFNSSDNWFCILKINSILYLVILYVRTVAAD